MKKTSMITVLALFAATMMLSGCLFPYYGDEGGHRGGGHYEGHHDHGGDHDHDGDRR